MSVVIETTIGDFTVDLFTEERPQTCRNFLKLCKIKYYNWNLFHSVQNNFIAQTGDPTSTGKGGESIYGKVLSEKARYYEAEQIPKIKHDRAGLLSMVDCGNNMLGSQFFITLAPDLQSLDGQHCVFGEIVEGLEIILKFNETLCDNNDRPYQDVRISHTVILEDPYDDPKGLVIPDRSPEPTQEVLMSDRIGADEAIDDTEGMTAEEILEMQKEKEARARATILEIVGDLPDADIAPPENVLFVCKLHPVTNDDDLEIIFSRFGKIIGCEVIRDRKTGESLQYAFIEFEDRKSCEEAYLKMDNVLIDDRRIHVDFSQSVSKMLWRGKGKGIQYFSDSKQKKNRHDHQHKSEDSHNSSYSKRRSKNDQSDKSNEDSKSRDRKEYYSRHKRRNGDEDRRRDESYDERRRRESDSQSGKSREERRNQSRSKERKSRHEEKHYRKDRHKDYSNYESYDRKRGRRKSIDRDSDPTSKSKYHKSSNLHSRR